MGGTSKLPRPRAAALWMLAVALCGGGAHAGNVFDSSSCTSLTSVPVNKTIDYGAGVQGIFESFDGNTGCKDCHTSNGGVIPGNLNLDPAQGSPWFNIVNVPTDEVTGGLNYVTPGKPEESFLFRKINCDLPGFGARMPDGFPALTLDQQATIYDWIAAGAPIGTTDQIFRGTFDLRGFVP